MNSRKEKDHDKKQKKKTEHLTLEKTVILKKTNNSKLMSEDQTTPASIKLKQTVVKKEAIKEKENVLGKQVTDFLIKIQNC